MSFTLLQILLGGIFWVSVLEGVIMEKDMTTSQKYAILLAIFSLKFYNHQPNLV